CPPSRSQQRQPGGARPGGGPALQLRSRSSRRCASATPSEGLPALAEAATATKWRNHGRWRVHEGSMPALLLLLLTASAPAASLLVQERAWVGEGAAQVAGYDATADCEGPRGPYRTRIAYRRSDAWARFTQWRDDAQTWDSVALGEDTWVSGDA